MNYADRRGEIVDAPRVFTEAELTQIRQSSGRGIMRALAAQGAMLVLAVVLSAVVGGMHAGWSAFVGGLAYFLPNTLFALRLLIGIWGAKDAGPFTFFIGEAFKLGAAVLILGLAVWLGGSWIVWPAMLFGLLCVLKGYVLLLAFRRLP